MTAFVRRAGAFHRPDGTLVAWTVAEGRRGRRWRWSDAAGTSFTLETAPDGRFSKLEAAAGAILLTLHREADGSLQGNRVAEDGIRHLRFDPPTPRLVLAGWSPLAVAAALAGLRQAGGGEPQAVLVDDALEPGLVRVVIDEDRDGARGVGAGDRRVVVRLDADGLPLVGGGGWPLEAG